MIRYPVDSSTRWRILREPAIRAGWADVITDHGIGSCHPQRAEFRRSALYPDVAMPTSTWQWVESAQYRLVRAGGQRTPSCVDLLICAVAAQQGLVILHDDNKLLTAARHLTELRERRRASELGRC